VTRVGIIGLGVVGGTAARRLAEVGVAVRGYDRYLPMGSPEDLQDCSLVFVCVPTPREKDGSHDVSEVWEAVRSMERHVQAGTVVVIKSTVPPGTCDRLADAFPRLELASMPEFLVAARPMETFSYPDRLVIGAYTTRAASRIAEVMRRAAPRAAILFLRPIEAELVKLSSNAMLAAKVIMANELAEVCARFGVEWSRVQEGVGLDHRIGPSHLNVTPERGFDGSCLPKDLDGLIAASRAAGYDPPILTQIAEFNRAIRMKAASSKARKAVVRSSAGTETLFELTNGEDGEIDESSTETNHRPGSRPDAALASWDGGDGEPAATLTEQEQAEIEEHLTYLGYI
jgi:UDPglucose 6-dehydrogenase